MNQELFHAFNTAFSRAKKSGADCFVVPHRDKVFLSKYSFSVKDNKIFYIVKNTGTIIKYDGPMIFNMGKLDNLREDDYNVGQWI